ncbi:PREDICTED: cytochrome P450 76C2-like isoform X2 [Tarenaya hassleriana]|uniref:cytochrome P450 76C2-like isoform X2 n=1 Tax=Tarenaya hassleriana TaxID=28532 RepID=UPI00053C2923|nr:PREDICTED: cytochrome P450 76C2-like isoform X2 [Tarenaya hassleriana]
MDISSSQILLLACFLLPFLLLFASAKSRRRSAALPPGPPRFPVIGNILDVGKNPHHSLADLSKTYGPVMSLKLGNLTTVVVSSPEAAKEVLQVHDQVLSGRTPSDPVRAIGHHDVSVVWLPASAHWRQLRKILATQLFSPQRLEATKPLRMNKLRELLGFLGESCSRGEAVDIARSTFVTSLNIISNILFSVDFAGYDSKISYEYQDAAVRIMEVAGKPNIADFFPFLGFLDLQGSRKEIKACTERLFRVFQGFIDARIAKRLTHAGRKDGSSVDLLDSLLDLAQGDKSELGLKDVKHFLLDMFLAGTDTSSSTVEWAMVELLRNPKVMAKAQAEIARVIDPKGVVQESDIAKLPYLQAVVKETFRLHPPAPLLIPRKAESDVQILGFLVPKNAQVLINVWAIGRDPNVWENPMKFEPERFLERETDMKGKDFELTPFGAGRRICPGMPLALKTVPLVLASLLHSFDWKLQNGVVSDHLDMDEAFGVTLHKANPLYAVPVKKRDVSQI